MRWDRGTEWLWAQPDPLLGTILPTNNPPELDIPQSGRPPSVGSNRGLELGVMERNLFFGGFPLHALSNKTEKF